MKIDQEVTLVISAIILVTGTVTAYHVYFGDRVVDPYSEIGLLGPNMTIGGYPSELQAGEPLKLNIYLGNYEGQIKYYRVVMKLTDAPDRPSDEALAAPVIETHEAIIQDGRNKTIPIRTMVNEVLKNHRVVFELHAYTEETGDFEYTGRWCQLWLNTTSGTSLTPP